MAARYECRLTIIGPAKKVLSFDGRSKWRVRLGVKHIELYQHSPGRMVWWFETTSDPTIALRTLARAGVTLLLFYEEEELQECGLVKAVMQRLDLCHFDYSADRRSR